MKADTRAIMVEKRREIRSGVEALDKAFRVFKKDKRQAAALIDLYEKYGNWHPNSWEIGVAIIHHLQEKKA